VEAEDGPTNVSDVGVLLVLNTRPVVEDARFDSEEVVVAWPEPSPVPLGW